jgi:hypothetical protein
MNVLATGGAGLIGSRSAEASLAEGVRAEFEAACGAKDDPDYRQPLLLPGRTLERRAIAKRDIALAADSGQTFTLPENPTAL